MGRKRSKGGKPDCISALTEPWSGGVTGEQRLPPRVWEGWGAGSAGAKGAREAVPRGGGGWAGDQGRLPGGQTGRLTLGACLLGAPHSPWRLLMWNRGGSTWQSMPTAHTGWCHQPAHKPSASFLPLQAGVPGLCAAWLPAQLPAAHVGSESCPQNAQGSAALVEKGLGLESPTARLPHFTDYRVAPDPVLGFILMTVLGRSYDHAVS